MVTTYFNQNTDFFHRWHRLHLYAMHEHIPVISLNTAVFLDTLIKLYRPQSMLEIGSAIGVSSAWIGNILRTWTGHLDTLDINLTNYHCTQHNLNSLNINNVKAYHADALLWLAQRNTQYRSLNDHYDCIFIDAHKSNSHIFYTACLLHLKPNGLIIIDDAWKFRHKMHGLYHLMHTQKQYYQLHFIDHQDAILLIKPKTLIY